MEYKENEIKKKIRDLNFYNFTKKKKVKNQAGWSEAECWSIGEKNDRKKKIRIANL